MVDRYTKVMLTIIACCLVYLCLHTALSVPAARAAQNLPTDVRIVGVSIPLGQTAEALPVRLVKP